MHGEGDYILFEGLNFKEVMPAMCGFAGVFGDCDGDDDSLKVRVMLDRISHRGPDDRGIYEDGPVCFGQHGLAIVDLKSDRQPLSNEDGSLWIVGDVEAYGLHGLRQRLETEYRFATDTAVEVILKMYEKLGPACVDRLDSAFAFAVYDRRKNELFIARDALGVKPLYYGFDADGTLYFASEIKALAAVIEDIRQLPPGHYYHSRTGLQKYYSLPSLNGTAALNGRLVDDPQEAVDEVHDALERAVRRRMTADAPLGTFLSGGLDSSLITAMAARRKEKLPSFAVGMEGSADLEAARFVAEYLGTDHYEHVITAGEIRAVLPQVIYHLESFDPALVRGAIANYFAARLAAEHVKVVLTGEGADELFGGYTYLKRFDVQSELPRELHQITEAMHSSGLQRLDRLNAAHSVAGRPPFLDPELVDLAFHISPRLKMYGEEKVEKWVLRKVAEGYLPEDIIWRGKEKFALGTGTADVLQQLAEEHVSEDEYERNCSLPNGFKIKSREELYYYKVFERFFPAEQLTHLVGRSRSLDADEMYA